LAECHKHNTQSIFALTNNKKRAIKMRYLLSHNDAYLAQLGFDRYTLTCLAEEEEEELASLGVNDQRFYGTFGVQPPRPPPSTPQQQQQQPPPPRPQPTVPAKWDWISARVENGTNTYHSFSAKGLVSSCIFQTIPSHTNISQGADGERAYIVQDGTYRWASLCQKAVNTLVGEESKNESLPQMVGDVGGDPANFRSKKAMARFVLDRERPLRVLREEDRKEIFSGSFPVDLGRPAAGCYWGVGRWQQDGSLAFTRLRQDEAERSR
jgi:hypothetical protein